MLYSAAAAILGPSLLLQLRSMSELKYISELLQIVCLRCLPSGVPLCAVMSDL